MKRIAFLILGLLLGVQSYAQVIPGGGTVAPGPSSAITGNLQTATGGNVTNGTLSFSISQPAVVSGTSTLVGSSVSCYTSNTGNIVGLPEPLAIPVVNTVLGTGTLPAATYYVKFAYLGANGTSLASPEATVVLESIGSLDIPAPAIQPTAATGFFAVYIGTTPGGETLQGIATGWTQFAQSSPLVTGSPVPSANTSSCNVYLSDELIPTGTYYTVSLTNKNGAQIAGFPQTWCTYGGENATINVSNGAPTGNCGTNGVFYPTPIFADPQNGAAQSINGLVSFPQGANVTGLNATTGQNELGQVNTFNNVLHVGSGITIWSGSDIGAQLNSAYAALPPAGGEIDIDPQVGGACYNFATGVVFNTPGKLVNVVFNGGACLNYTPTTGNAFFVDYVAIGVLPASFHGFKNMILINNNCSTSQGCGGSAVGIMVGNTNQGDLDASMISDTIQGFAVGYQNNNALAVQIQWYAPTITSGITGFVLGPLTGFELNGGTVAGNQTAIKLTATGQIELSIFGTQFFSNISTTAGIIDATAVVGAPGAVDCHDCHFEIQPSGGEHMVAGNVDIHMFGGLIVDDNSSAGTGDWFFSLSGNAFDLFGTEVLCGRTTMTQAFLLNAPVRAGFLMPYIGNTKCTAVVGGANATRATVWPYSAPAVNPQPAIIEAPLALTENGNSQTPVLLQDICYGNSSTHSYQCSFNGGPFMTMEQVVTATLTTTAATTDVVTVTGMTTTGHCSLTPTNLGAAGGIASVFISAKAANQITVTHTATASWTFDVICTPQ